MFRSSVVALALATASVPALAAEPLNVEQMDQITAGYYVLPAAAQRILPLAAQWRLYTVIYHGGIFPYEVYFQLKPMEVQDANGANRALLFRDGSRINLPRIYYGT